MRHQEPTRRRAGGSILPHKPGNWQTADGQVHFPSGVSGLRYGRATPFRDGAGGMWFVPGWGGTPPSGRGSKHMASRGVPLPQSVSLLSVVQSPPLLARLGLIVREAATARGLPHPGTARGGDGLEGVGEGAGCMTWGEGDVLPWHLGRRGRDFRRAGATVGGARVWAWSVRLRTRGPGGRHHLRAP